MTCMKDCSYSDDTNLLLKAQLNAARETVAACRRTHEAAMVARDAAMVALSQATEEDKKARLALIEATRSATEAQREVLRTDLVAAAVKDFAEEIAEREEVIEQKATDEKPVEHNAQRRLKP